MDANSVIGGFTAGIIIYYLGAILLELRNK